MHGSAHGSKYGSTYGSNGSKYETYGSTYDRKSGDYRVQNTPVAEARPPSWSISAAFAASFSSSASQPSSWLSCQSPSLLLFLPDCKAAGPTGTDIDSSDLTHSRTHDPLAMKMRGSPSRSVRLHYCLSSLSPYSCFSFRLSSCSLRYLIFSIHFIVVFFIMFCIFYSFPFFTAREPLRRPQSGTEAGCLYLVWYGESWSNKQRNSQTQTCSLLDLYDLIL